MALPLLLSLEFPLGGFISMSGWFPFRNDLEEMINSNATQDSDGNDDLFESAEADEADESEDQDPSIVARVLRGVSCR